MRFIELEDSEKEELVRRYANHKNATVRKRVQALILSSQYYSMKEIIEATGVSRTTLYRFFKEWENTELSERIETLFIKDGRGTKSKLDSVKDKLPYLVKKYNRNIRKILQVLEDDCNIRVCSLTMQKYLKKAKL